MENKMEKVDVLNRDEFICRVVQLIKLISSHKGNMTFAINGEWGCGKTFVLDRIQKKLDEDESRQFLVIPFNCWQYDYYDEPLIAIVSVLLDFVENTQLFSKDMKITLLQVFSQIGAGLFSQFVKMQTGIDVKGSIDSIKSTIKGTKEEIEKANEFDSFYDFKKALIALKVQLEELSKDHTLVFAVDELDRCLPTYAIKVLERLHHIAEGIPNMITIIAVDRKRLDNTVNSIFGAESAENYLKKFIRFYVELDLGKQNSSKFFEKHDSFYRRFNPSLYDGIKETNRFIEELFQEIDIRTQEQIVEKTSIIHDVCFGDEELDCSIMYMELFFAVLLYFYKSRSIFKKKKTVYHGDGLFALFNDLPKRFNNEYSGFNFKGANTVSNNNDAVGIIIDSSNLYMLAFYYWYNTPEPKNELEIGGNEVFPFIVPNDDKHELQIKANQIKINKFVNTLRIIG